MSAENGGGFGTVWAVIGQGAAVGKEIWAAFVGPAVIAYLAWRKNREDRADTRAKERRTEEQRRDEEWRANLDRAGTQVQAHVKWQEERAVHAEAKLREAEAELDAVREKLDAKIAALTEERWRLLGSLNNHRHAVANLRQTVNALERKLGQDVTTWHPVEEP